ncbi:PAS domain-containing protein [Roseateles oligotrophus]|uniref:histidine kinase n=1 Tax=Roseateles oligotrophus TaxID=1769250 RepID=A0ABT2YBC3_9BURK|nr:PAS domain-containing protein [Roseateles oligotrophus]MCV2366917.1 PAS domain-containing protein [Roseateles oligotrophus]
MSTQDGRPATVSQQPNDFKPALPVDPAGSSVMGEQAVAGAAAELSVETIIQVIAASQPGMAGYWDEHLRCRFANPAYQAWFGKTQDEMRGRTIQNLQGDELFKKNEPHIRLALEGIEQSFERKLIKPNGAVAWLWVRYFPHRMNDKVIGFVALVLDITERKLTEHALQASETRLLDAKAVANIGSWETDLTSLDVIWSAQTYKIFDLDAKTFQASHPAFLEFVHPHDRAAVDAAFLKSLGHKGANSIEHRIVSATGVTKYVQERWRIECDPQGLPVRALGTCQDVTETKSADEAKRQIADRLALATRASGVGIWDYDIVGNKIVWDDAMYALYGIAPTQFANFYEAWHSSVHPEDQARSDEEVQRAIRGEGEFDTEFRIRRPDGTVRNIRAVAMVQRDADGLALRMVGSNWDITEQKHNEVALQASLREKEALLKEVHHRVKNNLQVITSLLRLEAGRSAVADTKEVLGSMRGRIRTMAQLHETLYRSGTFASVDLGVYLGQVATQAFKSQELHGDLVRLALNLGSVNVGMDQATAAGLLLNELISNCLKHGFPEGRAGEVRVELQPAHEQGKPSDDRWCLCVRDSGVGLAADFEEKRKTSLGLQLVHDLSDQFGGILVIDSVAGQGVRFNVVFTVQAPAALVMPP